MFYIKLGIFQHLTKVGCRLLTESTEAIWKLFDLLNYTAISSSSPQAEMAMSWTGHVSVVSVALISLNFGNALNRLKPV